ncbi:hypothetical protein, partial [Alistipes putredinis]|uniref:hypothetical protein n=3 Tax=Rikenellaceae TaxID=171550 RepID=UPI003AB65141
QPTGIITTELSICATDRRPVGAAGGKDGEKSARKCDGRRDALARSVLSYISKPTKDFSLDFTLQKFEYSKIIARFLFF